jgi:predicted HicB family RNase H-like nuclease
MKRLTWPGPRKHGTRRLPRSVHAALLAEAKAKGVSFNQLCLSKLVAQLRAVI